MRALVCDGPGLVGHLKVPFPTVLGHEFCGRIARVGEGVAFATGERAPLAVTGACGEALKVVVEI